MENPFEQIDHRLTNIEELLLDIKNQLENPSPAPEPTEEILTVEQTAKYLNLTKATIYSKVSRGDLPVMKRGGRLYFSQQDLLDHLKQGRKKTNDEKSKEADDYLLRTRK